MTAPTTREQERAAFDAWCAINSPLYYPSDDGMGNRRDWKVWQARAALSTPERAWISVAERLPEPGVVILAGGSNFVTEAIFNGGGHWWILLDDGSISARVTHWQPMPAPPGEAA